MYSTYESWRGFRRIQAGSHLVGLGDGEETLKKRSGQEEYCL